MDYEFISAGSAGIVKAKKMTTTKESHIKNLLISIGEDPDREGLKDTPKRVVKSWETLFGGYKQNPKDILTTQFNSNYKSMIVCDNIEFYSTCEHHLLPFYGVCHIGYIPNKKIIGLSKMPRLLEVFARRLQIQERLTDQIADSLMENIDPLGCGVIIKSKHMCMNCRGIQKRNASMITSSIRGIFFQSHVKDEFTQLINLKSKDTQ
jgi:GTP cyclohydrolase I